MANAYFKQFAIENNLTIDYGYMYGKYRDFYISLKETLGSTKILNIITKLGNNNDELKKVLSVFNEDELPEYCISDMKKTDNYLQFTFELPNNKSEMLVNFINKFIDSYIANNLKVETICPICHESIKEDEKVSIIDMGGILTPMHEKCYEVGKQKAKEKVVEKNKEINKDTKGYKNGILGAVIYGIIYAAILIVSFFFIQFIIRNTEETNGFVLVFQYAPVLVALSACPIIYSGYDAFKGTKGTTKYLVVFWTVIVTTLVGTFFGFVASLLIFIDGYSFKEILEVVVQLITCKDIQGVTSFRWGFYIYMAVALGLACLSMVFKFSGKEEMDEANSSNFEKLD